MIPILLAAFGAGGVAFIIWALMDSPAGAIDDETQAMSIDTLEDEARLSLREQFAKPIGNLAAPLLRGQRRDKLQLLLNRADLNLRSAEWVLIQLGLAAVLGIGALLRFGNPFPVAIAVVIGYLLPTFYLRRRMAKRRQAFEAVLGDTISLVSNSVKAGYSIQQAMASVAENGRPPLAEEIGRVVRESSLGIDTETALQHANERLASKDFDLLVTAILIHRSVGGNLSEVLDKIAETIRERVRVHGEVRVLTAQARASGYIITALPFAVGALLSVISPTFERPLFTSPIGWGMLAVGLVSISIGYAIIRKITDIHL
ncbi:MAG TPA: type II secretion system F family protein [Candidatus Dormibacteraeota bacterium]|jgi:tight adherence protein B|nr:type II secretion system F family protein [Candidatus Dormibacteraeota bacterium]